MKPPKVNKSRSTLDKKNLRRPSSSHCPGVVNWTSAVRASHPAGTVYPGTRVPRHGVPGYPVHRGTSGTRIPCMSSSDWADGQ
eukprot:1153722-Rhodomonas_salina.1